MQSRIDKDRPSTWPRFHHSMCSGCHSNCCTLPVEISADDLVRMGLADSYDFQPKRVARDLIKKRFIKHYRSSTQLFTLAQRADGSCIFLNDDRMCSIYEKRPNVCRDFPKIGPRPGYCPANRKSKSPS